MYILQQSVVKYTATKEWFMSLLKDSDVNGQTALY